MSLTAEEIAKRECEAMTDPNKVKVRVGVLEWNGIKMPVAEDRAEAHVEAVFNKMTVGDNRVIEDAVSYMHERPDGKEQRLTDVTEYRRLLMKRNLLEWDLCEVEREGGWMTSECYKKIGKMAAPLVEAILDRYESSMTITRDEERVIDRQAAILFGKNSRGVADACEAVRKYCNLGSFWEKFGLREEQLDNMHYKDFLMLKIMSAKEIESQKASAPSGKKPVTKIAGPGGRVRQSRGVVVGRD